MADKKQKHPLPDNSVYEEREPEQEPATYPSTGQHQPDIQDDKVKNKRNQRPQGQEIINREDVPGSGDPKEYHDGEPVEEKSPRASL